ncbi:MAG: hypothetical protein ACHQ9S_20915 [Candidatus Binatia bacterium]
MNAQAVGSVWDSPLQPDEMTAFVFDQFTNPPLCPFTVVYAEQDAVSGFKVAMRWSEPVCGIEALFHGAMIPIRCERMMTAAGRFREQLESSRRRRAAFARPQEDLSRHNYTAPM